MHLLVDNEVPKAKFKKIHVICKNIGVYKLKIGINHSQRLLLNVSLVNMIRENEIAMFFNHLTT